MFPTAYSTIYRNDDGEVIGWDSPAYDDGDDPDDYYDAADYDDENECEGHDSLSGPIGYVTFCDGSCLTD